MRAAVLFLLLFSCSKSYAQDSLQNWMSFVNQSNYRLLYDKHEIPSLFLPYINYDYDNIANPSEKFQVGCVVTKPLPRRRLNWIARDFSNHWIISISYGGRVSGVEYYYFYFNNSNITVTKLHFDESNIYEPISLDRTTVLYALRRFSICDIERIMIY